VHWGGVLSMNGVLLGGLEFEKWAMLEALYTRCYAVTSGILIRLLWTLDFWIPVPHTLEYFHPMQQLPHKVGRFGAVFRAVVWYLTFRRPSAVFM
jgi:hypothetical protein